MNLLLLATFPFLSASAVPHDASAPRGLYVEARTAAVFAGACHYGSQFTTEGRTALAGWRVEQGAKDGVSLAGVELAVVVDAQANLKDARADASRKRSSVVYVDAGLAPEVERAALEWLRAEHGTWLGTIVAVERADVLLRSADDTFALRIGESIRLEGAALPERQCCKMPYEVWYEPLVALRERLVGRPETFAVREDRLGLRFSRPGENDAFFGRFGPAEDGK